MRALYVIILFLIAASCSDQPLNRSITREELLPDTTKSWSGQTTKAALGRVRLTEQRLKLAPMTKSIAGFELRIWNTASFYDPQTLFILKKSTTDGWELQAISYNSRPGDSVVTNHVRSLLPAQVENLHLETIWGVISQSDLENGDSFGCTDGSDLFMEMVDAKRHKILWFRCPSINATKDSNIRGAQAMFERVRWLSELDTD